MFAGAHEVLMIAWRGERLQVESDAALQGIAAVVNNMIASDTGGKFTSCFQQLKGGGQPAISGI
jgi:hypothetical protein